MRFKVSGFLGLLKYWGVADAACFADGGVDYQIVPYQFAARRLRGVAEHQRGHQALGTQHGYCTCFMFLS